MPPANPQVPWTEEQWTRVETLVQQEAGRARVAATFLPLYGPLPPDADFVAADSIQYVPQGDKKHQRMTIDDVHTVRLATLQVRVFLRGAQMADPDMTSVLALFRRAANVLARLEDAVVFNGLEGTNQGPAHGVEGLPAIWDVLGGQRHRGLLRTAGSELADPLSELEPKPVVLKGNTPAALGEDAVGKISEAIGRLEARGHFGPFALVLDQAFFTAVQTPNKDSLVLPQDRILPFLGEGGSLLRSSTLPGNSGVVVALGGAPVELVVATDVTCGFLQVTPDPMYVFRVYEKMVLRIKEPGAIVSLAKG